MVGFLGVFFSKYGVHLHAALYKWTLIFFLRAGMPPDPPSFRGFFFGQFPCLIDVGLCPVSRVWLLKSFPKAQPQEAQVYYMDYGNLCPVPYCNLRSNLEPGTWELPPMALPFTLTGRVCDRRGQLLMGRV